MKLTVVQKRDLLMAKDIHNPYGVCRSFNPAIGPGVPPENDRRVFIDYLPGLW